jgi:hypothetical protein
MIKNKDSDNELEDDYDFSREIYHKLIEQGLEGLDAMMEIFKETEHPRSGEVLSNMMKNIADINDKLMDLQKKKASVYNELNKRGLEAPKDETQKLTQNNIFVGSTAELQKRLANKKIDNIIIDDSD